MFREARVEAVRLLSLVLLASSPVSELAGQGIVGGDGPDAEVIGRVVDVAVDNTGRAYILDGEPPQVLVVGNKGRITQRLSRIGSGPGELRAPTKMQLDENGMLYVLDPAQQRLSVFRTRPRLEYETDIRIPFAHARTFCLAEGRFFFLTADAGSPGIRVAERDGDSLRQRAVLAKFSSDHPLVSDPMFSATVGFRGQLACLPGDHRVIWANTILGDLQSVSTIDGASMRAHLGEFAAATIHLRHDVLDLSVSRGHRMDLLLAVVPTTARDAIVTIGVKTAADPIDLQSFARLETQSIDDSLRAGVRQSSPAILGATSATGVVCYVNEPVPTVWIKRRGTRPSCR